MIILYIVLAIFAFFSVLILFDSYNNGIVYIEDILAWHGKTKDSASLTKTGKYLTFFVLYIYFFFLAPTLLFWYIVTKLVPSILYKKEI